MDTFLNDVYPLYPVVRRDNFIEQYRSKNLPWMLLHAVCFAAATYCREELLNRAGFANRKHARLFYYKKAKAIFDVGYYTEKIVVLQSAILLSLWGGGHNHYWNYASWIGLGVTIAESLGIHRSMANVDLDPEYKSFLKILWWTLFVRDTCGSGFSGRQSRINIDLADVEVLVPNDFASETESMVIANHPLARTFSLYQVETVKVSIILRKIILSKRRRLDVHNDQEQLHHELRCWREALPEELKWRDGDTRLGFLQSCLLLACNHNLILLYFSSSFRSAMQRPNSTPVDDTINNICEKAAQQISTIMCIMVTNSTILLLPHEAFHGLFLAETVFFSQTLDPDSTNASNGQMALNACQMIWHIVRHNWDPSWWIMKLFENLGSRHEVLREGRSRGQEDVHNSYPQTQNWGLDMHGDNNLGAIMNTMFDVSIDIDGFNVETEQDAFPFNLDLAPNL